MSNKNVRKLIIPAAGAGTRLLPITKFVSKEMLKIIDRPVVYYLLDEAYRAGIREAIFIIHPEKVVLRRYLSSRKLLNEFPNLKIRYIYTKNRFGDGHAIFQARRYIPKGEPFAVSMADLLSASSKSILGELVSAFKKVCQPIISVETAPREDTHRYGVISPQTLSKRITKILDIIEKPNPKLAPSNLVLTGKYILTPDIFSYLDELVRVRKYGEVKLSRALKNYCRAAPLWALRASAKHYDTGTKLEMLKTEIHFALKDPSLIKQLRLFLCKL